MLRVTLCFLVVGTAMAADFLSYEYFAGKSARPETLHSFSWQNESSENPILRVCFSWNETEPLSEPFQLTYTNENGGNEITVISNIPEALEEEICGNVPVDSTTLSYSTVETYVVNYIEAFAFAQFRLSIEPYTLRSESLTAANITRVSGLTNYDLDNCYDDTNSSSCFLFYGSTTPEALCTLSQDESGSGPDIQVCDSTFSVTQVDTQTADTKSLLLYDDTYTVRVMTGAPATSTLQVLMNNADGGYDTCDEVTCDATQSPGTSIYTLLVVEVDQTTKEAISSDRVTIQDLDLTVVHTTPVVDFHLANKYNIGTYKLYSSTEAGTVFDEVPITLDCSEIPADSPCYAFVDAENGLTYLGVSYSDETNGVIAKIN